jgi:hypothetical protein
MEILIVIVYIIAGYWAVGKTIYANKIVFGTWDGILMQRVVLGFVIGWLLIPVAIIKSLLGR